MNIKETVAQGVALAANLNPTELMDMLEVPPDPKMGDLALPCFRLAKVLRQSPQKKLQKSFHKK